MKAGVSFQELERLDLAYRRAAQLLHLYKEVVDWLEGAASRLELRFRLADEAIAAAPASLELSAEEEDAFFASIALARKLKELVEEMKI